MTNEPLMAAVDALSAAAIIATLAGVLPPIAALLAIIWHGLNIYFKYIRRP